MHWLLLIVLAIILIAAIVLLVLLWRFLLPSTGKPEQYWRFVNPETEKHHKGKNIPAQILHDAYFKGDIDLQPGLDLLATLRKRAEYAEMTITPENIKFVLTTFLPEVIMHTRKQDEYAVQVHYDFGSMPHINTVVCLILMVLFLLLQHADDLFHSFLGNPMLYTCALFSNEQETIDQAQQRKLEVICQKAQVKQGDQILDIGCGW